MLNKLKPIRSNSLKNEVISHFENLILSGKIAPGEKLPPERELARKLEVSRPVVHEALLDLELKGFVTIKPRRGATIIDYRKEGTIALLTSLLEYQNTDSIDPQILSGLLHFRTLTETEFTRLSALNRTETDIKIFEEILEKEKQVNQKTAVAVAELDFELHHSIAFSTGNLIYPLLLNSFKQMYIIVLTRFYQNKNIIPMIYRLHRELIAFIKSKNSIEAEQKMREILNLGENELKKLLNKQEE